MSIDGKVILLTGAAATGKRSLSAEIAKCIRPLHKIDFGRLLLDHKIQQGHPDLTYEDLRRQSAQLITRQDVQTVDEKLINSIPGLRETAQVLIDSHAVTREDFGYRITHYSLDQLRRIAFDVVIMTYCDPITLAERHSKDPQGRPQISPFEAQHHMNLQEALGVSYSIACGCPCVLLNTTKSPPSKLARKVRSIIRDLGCAIAG